MTVMQRAGLAGWLIIAGLSGCAAGILPPSESTIAILQSYRNQLDSRVASGHLPRAQARDLLYAKLVEIQPPLPNLRDLMEFRKQVEAQVEAKVITPEQAEAKLAAHESEMMTRWEEMAAKYAREQREFDRLKKEQERGFQQQQMPVGGRPF